MLKDGTRVEFDAAGLHTATLTVSHEENCIGCMLCYQVCPDFCINVDVKSA